MFLELLAAALLCADGLAKQKNPPPKSKTPSPSFFRESDSFFDKDGEEHFVDEDGYCDECDDYHDF